MRVAEDAERPDGLQAAADGFIASGCFIDEQPIGVQFFG